MRELIETIIKIQEQSNQAVSEETGFVTKTARKLGANLAAKVGAKKTAANLQGKVKFDQRVSDALDDFNAFLGGKNKGVKDAVKSDLYDFLAKYGLKSPTGMDLKRNNDPINMEYIEKVIVGVITNTKQPPKPAGAKNDGDLPDMAKNPNWKKQVEFLDKMTKNQLKHLQSIIDKKLQGN